MTEVTPPSPGRTPVDVRLHRKQRMLQLVYADGEGHELPCELLRVWSPSAEVRGHGDGERVLQTGKKYVNITAIEPVGHYAIRLTFDDGHQTGLYTWEWLDELGCEAGRYWSEYLTELKKANASRLPPIATVAQWQPSD